MSSHVIESWKIEIGTTGYMQYVGQYVAVCMLYADNVEK
jgi:hypothetical protein